MTIQEFLLLHTTGAINFSGQINVLYDEESDGTGTITAITVTENALFYNGNTLESNLNITNILTQAEQVTFTFDDVLYILTVVDINFIPMSPGFSFYLFQVESETSILCMSTRFPSASSDSTDDSASANSSTTLALL